jgi:formamidase
LTEVRHLVPPDGHNRWSGEVEPVLVLNAGDTVTFDAPEGTRGQLTRESTHDDLLHLDLSADLLTGPVFVDGAEPGDALAVEFLEVETDDFGFSLIFPGFGLLAHEIEGPYLLTWDISDGFARSEALPGVAIPAAPFPGTIGVAPSAALVDAARLREAAWTDGGDSDSSDEGVVPAAANGGLSTLPPRENGGNIDIPHLIPGSRLFLPVFVPGALLSLGDVHFAQGAGEVCGSAIETGARVTVRVDVIKQPHHYPTSPVFEVPPTPPRRYFATTGISGGPNAAQPLDLNEAARAAVRELITFLVATRGYTREAAYVLASVCAELRVSQVVDFPNALVSALLPLDVFDA